MPTIGGQTITRGEIRIPKQEDWWADISTDSNVPLAVGSRVELVVEGLTLSGAIIRGGVSGDVGRYQVSGRPEWLSEVAPKGYRSSVIVRMRAVVEDLAREVLGNGFAPLVVLPVDKQLGNHYERPGTDRARLTVIRARDVLAALRVPWYVRADGVTVFAERSTGVVSTPVEPLISERNLTLGMRIVNTDLPEAFVPGLTFDGDVISEVVIRINADNYKLDVWSEPSPFAKAVIGMVRRLAPDLWWRGVFVYQCVGPAQPQATLEDPVQWWKYDLRPVSSKWLPEARAVEIWPGIAGYSAELAAGHVVLLAFADADLSKPVVVGFTSSPDIGSSGRPMTSNYFATKERHVTNANTEFQATGNFVADGASVNMGAAETRVLRSGDQVAIVTWSPPAAPVPIPGVSPAFLIHVADMPPLGTPIPTVQPSRVKA